MMNSTGKNSMSCRVENGPVRLKVEGAKNEVGNDKDDGCGDDLVEGVLDERLQPSPEEPFELRNDEERNENGAHQDTDGGSDEPESDYDNEDSLRGGEQNDDNGIDDGSGENRQSRANRYGSRNR